jgi:hypothetical protein
MMKHNQDKNNDDWIRSRFVATCAFNSNPNLKEMLQPIDVLQLSTDAKVMPKSKQVSKELFEAESRKVAKLFNGLKV